MLHLSSWMTTLPMMLIGMTGILLVIGFLVLVVMAVAQRDVHQDHIQRVALPRDEVQRRRAAVDDERVHLIAYHNFR